MVTTVAPVFFFCEVSICVVAKLPRCDSNHITYQTSEMPTIFSRQHRRRTCGRCRYSNGILQLKYLSLPHKRKSTKCSQKIQPSTTAWQRRRSQSRSRQSARLKKYHEFMVESCSDAFDKLTSVIRQSFVRLIISTSLSIASN